MMYIEPVGTEVYRNSREGGGAYVVTAHINCRRDTCKNTVALREQLEPSKEHKKRNYYYVEWAICQKCGLYMHNDRRIFIKH